MFYLPKNGKSQIIPAGTNQLLGILTFMLKMTAEAKGRITTLKKILSAGKGTPSEFRPNTKAIFHYEVFLPPKLEKKKQCDDQDEEEETVEEHRRRMFPEDRSLYECIDSTKRSWPQGYGKPLELVFGKKFQLPLFENCVRTMLVDEIAQFDVYEPRELLTFPMVSKKLRDIARAAVDPEFAHQQEHAPKHQCAATVTELGYPALDALTRDGPRPLRFVFHLLDVLQSDDYSVEHWQMDEGQRLATVDALRADGNALFARKEYATAADKYREGMTLLDQLLLREKPGEPEWLDLDAKNVPLFLNLAQCYLNMGQFYEAANCADEALKREPDNEKALFRRAKARTNTWDLDAAEADLQRLLAVDGNCVEKGAVETQLREVAQRRREKTQNERKAYKAMFAGIGVEQAEKK